nr:uncharacterized protein LOC128686190 [Cherax quadricarinatus]
MAQQKSILDRYLTFTSSSSGANGDVDAHAPTAAEVGVEAGGSNVRVVTFNGDGAERGTTLMKYTKVVRMVRDYTLCLRFNVHLFRILNAVIYFLTATNYDEDPISFEVYFEKIRTKFGGRGRFYPLPANLGTNKWYHYCQVRDMTGGEGRVYLDGELIVREKVNFLADPKPRDVVIGQDQFKEKYQSQYSYSGKLSQVNVWGRVLSQEQIQSVSRCEVDLEGDVLAWSNPWEVQHVQEQVVALRELCGSVSRGRLVVPLPLLRYHDAVYVCKGLRGAIHDPATPDGMLKEFEYLKGIGGCERQWSAVTDEGHENLWYNPFTNAYFNNSQLFFRINNPDGDKYQNCNRLRWEGLEDTSCDQHSCAACHIPADSTWTLRGICEDEERMFYFNLEARPLGFFGFGEYAVEKMDDGGWMWYNTVTNTTMAILPHHHSNTSVAVSTTAALARYTYPMGRLTWETKMEVCGQAPGPRVLTLSPCTTSEFTCSDGVCIPFARRCDLRFDCEDKTDESLCDIINYPADYRSRLPPRPASDLALAISVSVTMDTLNVDTTNMLLSVTYNLRLTWYDNRLTYNNLKKLTRLNSVSQEQAEMLWRPTLSFLNTDNIQNTAVDSDAVTTVIMEDENNVPDLSNPYEVEIYQGDTNPVSTTRKYHTVFTCFFDLVLYPFDIQKCDMQFQILSASSEYLIFNLSGSSVEYMGPKLLVEYRIGKINLDVNNATQYSGSRVRVELIRRYGYAILNIYVPSFTLLIISYLTLFFRAPIFEVRLNTALTSLLVLATLFTQVSASLPKTSYFKMVDVWLLFCILLNFLIIIWHTVIDLVIDYGDGFSGVSGSSPYGDVSKTWAHPPPPKEAARHIEVTQVRPMQTGGTPDSGKGKTFLSALRLPATNFDFHFYIKTSKITTSAICLVFNLIYWGTLSAGSGLMYYT